MAGTASRRVFRLATVFSVALVQLALQPFQAAAATDTGTLFGMNGTAVYRIDTTTGALTAFAPLPPPPPTQMLPSFNGLASDPVGHRLFTVRSSASLDFSTQFYNLVTVDTQSAAVSVGPDIARGAPELAYDTSSGTLFAKSFCCPSVLLTVDPVTGAETTVSTTDLGFGSGFAMDSGSHNIYMTQDVFNASGFFQLLQSVNDQSAAVSVGSTQFPTGVFLQYLVFEGVAITPDSIQADVNSAQASGAIDNAGVATALVAQLNAA